MQTAATPKAPRLYLAGANTTQTHELVKGRHVLESFADIRVVTGAYRPLWGGALLDSGAFTVMTTGKPVDIGAYREFVAAHGQFYDACAALDVIDGDWKQSVANWRAMPGTFPTWHEGEPFGLWRDYLAEQSDGGWVGVGMQRVNGRINKPRCRSVLAELKQQTPEHSAHVHGWGLTMYATDYPFASTDSAAWIRMVLDHKNNAGLRHLTNSELMQITIARLERAPWRERWDPNWCASRADSTAQLSLLK